MKCISFPSNLLCREVKRILLNINYIKMATNPPKDNSRKGAVRDRSQTYNPKTDSWVKRDSDTGRFMDVKTSDNKPFKGVRKEKK